MRVFGAEGASVSLLNVTLLLLLLLLPPLLRLYIILSLLPASLPNTNNRAGVFGAEGAASASKLAAMIPKSVKDFEEYADLLHQK